MKALIFNSGLGSRLGELTAHNPKCLVKLGNGETIFHRQLRVLSSCGIREFVVTTGPFAEQVRVETREFSDTGCTFEFFANDVYDQTNYLYSFWLARQALLGHDILMLHGDLVFDAAYVQAVLDAPAGSLGSVNTALPQPPKDFKARIADGLVREVSVKIFDDDCFAFQPFYRLTAESLGIWLDAVDRFVAAGETGVYAENAANEVFEAMAVRAFSYEGHFVEEVDTPEDLARVSAAIRLVDFAQEPVYEVVTGVAGVSGVDAMAVQPDSVISEASRGSAGVLEVTLGAGGVTQTEFVVSGVPRDLAGMPVTLASGFDARPARDVRELLGRLGMTHPLVVAEAFFDSLPLKGALDATGIAYERFSGFKPNPTHKEVLAGVAAFAAAGCDSLISVGGGSAIDVAKCIKQFAGMDEADMRSVIGDGSLPYRAIPHVAIPTTAGTGSESTHFAVMYLDGKKLSIAADGLQPNAVVLDAGLLAGLPLYQKKCTMLDALCQAIESYWSVRSSDQSRAYSRRAIELIRDNYQTYLGLTACVNGDVEAGPEAEAAKTAGAEDEVEDEVAETAEAAAWAAGAAGVETTETAAWAIMRAANLAGKAINLTTTTAAHAMSYKLTSLYGIPHGHAVALCMPYTWQALIAAYAGAGYSLVAGLVSEDLLACLDEIAQLVCGCDDATAEDGLAAFNQLYARLDMPAYTMNRSDLDELVESVNLQRLSNFPLKLSADELRSMYATLMG